PSFNNKLSKNRGQKPLETATTPKQKPAKPNHQDPAKSTNCQELRSQNPAASDVAAVDERVIRSTIITVNTSFEFFS
ncbi:hypothetical protein, partial [Roseibium sp.]|uniref:hypothetical protein n=1 Tax=Roseibium sp. TaxID=1936156 RepID=UPI0032663282